MDTFRRVLLLALLAALTACLHGLLVGSEGSTLAVDPYAIRYGQTAELEGLLWVDARDREAYARGHMPDAVLLNENIWEEGLGEVILQWDPDASIVVYCDGEACGASRAVAERLREELGVETVYWLEGGWDSLEKEEGIQ